MNLLELFFGGFATIHQKLNKIMASQTQLAADLKVVKNQVAKIGQESSLTLKKVEELQAIIDAGEEVSPELQAAVDELKAQIQVVDDLVPDAPVSTDHTDDTGTTV